MYIYIYRKYIFISTYFMMNLITAGILGVGETLAKIQAAQKNATRQQIFFEYPSSWYILIILHLKSITRNIYTVARRSPWNPQIFSTEEASWKKSLTAPGPQAPTWPPPRGNWPSWSNDQPDPGGISILGNSGNHKKQEELAYEKEVSWENY